MRVKPYLAAVVSVALALLVRLALEPVLQERSPLLLFTLAVTMAAYYGGRKAGLLATILSALAGDYFFVSLTDRSEQVRVALFVGIGTSISLLSGAMYRAKSRARQELARRVAAEESERQQRSQQEQVFEQAGFGIAIVDPEAKRLLFVNPAFARMHGYTPEELAGRSPAETLAPEALEKLPQRVEETHREGHGAFESAHLRKDGSAFPVMVHVTAVKDSQGRVLHRIVYVQDISLQKEQQKQLQQAEAAFRQAQKMESLGILAGGIAHDFNNLLTAMIGNASLIWEELPPGSALQEPVERMLDASERMAKLTNQMLAYSGRGKFVVERLDVSKELSKITALIQVSIPKAVELRLKLASDLPLVEADASQVQQVIMNLVINAAEAIPPEGGTVEISTGLQSLSAEKVYGSVVEAPPGDYVALTVADTGHGMDAETLERIFEPFFTTKFTGRGLGLAAVQGIIRSHQGLLQVSSREGEGSVFQVFFPIAGAGQAIAHRASVTAKANQRPAGETGAVLVVDDEAIVRGTARAALERLGYAVLEAEDGRQALEILQRSAGQITVALLDLTMPGLSGEETLRGIRKCWPGLPVVASSGFSETEARSRFGGEISGYLQKPYTTAEVAHRVRLAIPMKARSI